MLHVGVLCNGLYYPAGGYIKADPVSSTRDHIPSDISISPTYQNRPSLGTFMQGKIYTLTTIAVMLSLFSFNQVPQLPVHGGDSSHEEFECLKGMVNIHTWRFRLEVSIYMLTGKIWDLVQQVRLILQRKHDDRKIEYRTNTSAGNCWTCCLPVPSPS